MATGYLASFEPAMRAALAEAAGAMARQPPDVPVGAVLLDAAGEIIGRGSNRCEVDTDPTAHAEIVALRAAAQAAGDWRLGGCTLVVTLEPCTMCAGAVLAARVDRVVYGAADRRAGAAGSLVGRAARPQARPADRGHRRGAGRGVRPPAAGVLRRAAAGGRLRPAWLRSVAPAQCRRSGRLSGGGVA